MQILATGSEHLQPSQDHHLAPFSSAVARPLRILALGDSLIYGFGDPEGGGWVERLRRNWMSPEQHGHVLYNLGVRGDRVQQVAQRLEHEFRHRGELRHQVPDGIILSVGVNDSARLGRLEGRNFTSFPDFQADLETLLDRAQQLCQVFFIGMTPVDESRMPFSNCLYYNQADQYRYKEATRLACLQRQIPYLDIFEQWLAQGEPWWRSRLSCDGLHPNSVGYEALLQHVLSWSPLQQWLTLPTAA
ncbi:GDSL-type esterase/lipase family protein [Thermocoleostomius sinensis]|uniref:GDSL-type esterase/lipase family protein n=1 Tax=Thermocoleostomius sinensis A174 TaxID=2016057 RepID=A0A9E8ZDR2_9CYAN|nr:GDSL-type esterase/lipase family protein [Thermocoleostomius sinensis]WAL59513.1 GDSL-type esterase/lipase family protein [Thermocoleostomius sinensis A174]